MPSEIPSHSQPRPFIVEDDLDIFAISSQWDSLLSFCQEGSRDRILDLRKVTDLDLCGMQALLLLDRQCQAHGAYLMIQELPEGLRERMKALGFPSLVAPRKVATP